MLIDLLASFYNLFGTNLFCFDKKIIRDDSFINTVTFDNWKGSLFKASNMKMKSFAAILLYL